ncbi:MAG TPA: hypothetical protein VGZ93_10820 [Candidatus Methylacidiphilales bacterium]|jgi:hypothetical protein|nr:hypothetical protein [Candidatus Methylacidiphilales bacterium]
MRWHHWAWLVLLPILVQADDNEVLWSKPVNGLRGKLIIPADQKRTGDPFVRVYLEFQNTMNVLGDRKIRYTEDALAMHIADESGKALGPAGEPYDGMSPLFETLVMPFDSTLRFFN